MGWKKFFGVSNYCGSGRAKAEKESEIQEMEHAVENNHRDADVCKRRLDELRSEED